MKTKLNSGGNPSEDAKPSIKRFKNIIKPIFGNQGFECISKTNKTNAIPLILILLLPTKTLTQTSGSMLLLQYQMI